MKNKTLFLILPILLLSAGCNLFSTPPPSGVVKTVNGGADWQFINTIKDSKNASLRGLNISKLGFDPQNHEIVYAGSYNGGLYKYTSADNNWTRILSKIYVYDFASHPIDSKTIYAAGFFDNKARVLKTTDGGGSWQEVYNEPGQDNVVRAIAINPSFPSQIFIGTSNGNVVKSADGGQSWQLASNFDDRVNSIVWQSGGVYVLTKTKGLFKAANYSDNFTSITEALTNPYGNGNRGSITSFNQMYVDSVTSSLIYVTASNGLYKTVDAGAHWNKMPLPVKDNVAIARAIAISKTSSNIVFASVDATVYKSVDGGQNFQTQSIATTGSINYILIDPVLPQIAYAGIYVQQ